MEPFEPCCLLASGDGRVGHNHTGAWYRLLAQALTFFAEAEHHWALSSFTCLNRVSHSSLLCGEARFLLSYFCMRPVIFMLTYCMNILAELSSFTRASFHCSRCSTPPSMRCCIALACCILSTLSQAPSSSALTGACRRSSGACATTTTATIRSYALRHLWRWSCTAAWQRRG